MKNTLSTIHDKQNIFERREETFTLNPRIVKGILGDLANPLYQIVNLIPENSRILDVGSGNGILAILLKELGKKVIIDAIEPDKRAQGLAMEHYSTLFTGGLEDYIAQTNASPQIYDRIILADVLEHIAQPEPLLRALKARLAPQGMLLISTPNIAFANIRLSLLNGEFSYVDSGILEKTHLRFYTLNTLKELFISTNFYPILQINCIRDPITSNPSIISLPFTPSIFNRLMQDKLATVFQFLFLLSNIPCSMESKDVGSIEQSTLLKYCKLHLKRYMNKNALPQTEKS